MTTTATRGPIQTPFTRKFGQAHPLAGAGLAFAGMTPDLAIAVSSAGGIGALGVGFMPPDELRANIHAIRAATDAPFNINFITCFDNDVQIRVCAEERVPIASFHWGHPSSEHIKLLSDAGVSLWEQVGTVEDGLRAVEDGMDVVIAQGWEAGGHNYGGLGTMAFTPAMVDAIAGRALVLASGGIVDGRGLAAALCLGADGVWIGTRLVASKEAHVHPYHHDALVRASGGDTIRSSVFGPDRPLFNPMRLLRNRVVAEYSDRIDDIPADISGEPVIGHTVLHGMPWVKHRFDVCLPVPETTGDFEEMPWLMGQGVGLVRDIRPAAEIVTEIVGDAAEILRAHAEALTA